MKVATQSVPCSRVEMLFKIADQVLVQLDKGLEFDFHPCFSQRDFWDNTPGDIESMKGFKEFIQFILVGAADKVDQKCDQNIERKFSLSGEVCFGLAVTVDKIGWNDNFPKKFDEFGTHFGKQVPCQPQWVLRQFSAWYTPFVMINACYYWKWVYHVDNQKSSWFVINLDGYAVFCSLKLMTLNYNIQILIIS